MRCLICLPFLILSSCTLYDGYSSDFEALQVGDTQSKVLNIMGEPDNNIDIELPMINLQQLVWSPMFSDRTYAVFILSNRVVAKTEF